MTYDVLKEFGASASTARRQYRDFVEQHLLEDDEATLALMGASRYAIGDDHFLERTEADIERRRTGGDADRDLALPRRVLSIAEIDEDGIWMRAMAGRNSSMVSRNRRMFCMTSQRMRVSNA